MSLYKANIKNLQSLDWIMNQPLSSIRRSIEVPVTEDELKQIVISPTTITVNPPGDGEEFVIEGPVTAFDVLSRLHDKVTEPFIWQGLAADELGVFFVDYDYGDSELPDSDNEY